MKSKAIIAICVLLALAGASVAAAMRTWTSKNGVMVTARFIRMDGNQVILQKTDGSFVSIDNADLSPIDHFYMQGRQNPEPVRLPTALEPQHAHDDAAERRLVGKL